MAKFLNRFFLLAVCLGTATAVAAPDDLAFLRQITRDVVEASRVRPGGRAGNFTNTCGFTLIMPGGNGGYPAFWVRDFSMSLEAGFITREEILNQLRLIARTQNRSSARRLKNGLVIPPYAIPDHINFDGRPVFYPGGYSSTEDQGDGRYGFLPPADDHYEFVHIAKYLYDNGGGTNFLFEKINGLTLLDRLVAAFDAPQTEAATGLVITDDAQRAVGFGFCDGIYFTGRILFPSLLRYQAAGELAGIFDALGKPSRYREIQAQISTNVVPAFADAARIKGWLMAATKIGRQPDVWGTLYAVHLGLLHETDTLPTILDAVRRHTITLEAAVRHVPTDMDFSPESAWGKTAGVPRNTYQNGAYWHTATGWLIEAVNRADRQLGDQLLNEYIATLRKNDFRLGAGHGAPWECFGPNGYYRNSVYMTSVTVPCSVLGAR